MRTGSVPQSDVTGDVKDDIDYTYWEENDRIYTPYWYDDEYDKSPKRSIRC